MKTKYLLSIYLDKIQREIVKIHVYKQNVLVVYLVAKEQISNEHIHYYLTTSNSIDWYNFIWSLSKLILGFNIF